jgi:hypothetical protein
MQCHEHAQAMHAAQVKLRTALKSISGSLSYACVQPQLVFATSYHTHVSTLRAATPTQKYNQSHVFRQCQHHICTLYCYCDQAQIKSIAGYSCQQFVSLSHPCNTSRCELRKQPRQQGDTTTPTHTHTHTHTPLTQRFSGCQQIKVALSQAVEGIMVCIQTQGHIAAV